MSTSSVLAVVGVLAGSGAFAARRAEAGSSAPPGPSATPREAPRAFRVVHVFVALCDNEHQGIVPVRAELGNGQDPRTNLYWGAMYGVKTFFRRSPHWTARASCRPEQKAAVLERALFESAGPGPRVRVVADAYDGAKMKEALRDFFKAASGGLRSSVELDQRGKKASVAAGGRAELVCFVGHNGLMDERLDEYPARGGRGGPASAVVLACQSHAYFKEPLRRAGCVPLVTTAGLMAPEAYTLDAVIRSWAAGDSPETVRLKAGRAYARYQRIAERAGVRLFVAGWGG